MNVSLQQLSKTIKQLFNLWSYHTRGGLPSQRGRERIFRLGKNSFRLGQCGAAYFRSSRMAREEKKLPHDHGQSMERELEQMPSVDDFQTVADIFKQLGDGSRIRIFWLLCHCEECVINLSSMVEMSSPAVSHHLKQLKAGGLIVSRRDGKEVYYKAAETERAQLLHHMIEAMVEIACPSA